MEVIATTNAPKALGPYSQAVLAGSILFVSGQIAINPETGEMVQSSIEAETQQVLDNIEAIDGSTFQIHGRCKNYYFCR